MANIDAVKKALLKYGIHNEQELDEAIKKMQPLNIGCMVSSANITNKNEMFNGREKK